LKVGALLVREWKGQLERVTILEDGFAWNGQTFGSLSQIAKAMTGTGAIVGSSPRCCYAAGMTGGKLWAVP
jgi:hypothetical protein